MEDTMDDVTKRVGDNLKEIREELGERARQVRDAVGEYVDANPLASVGIAFGVGYLLSGALFSRTTFRAAHLGARFALGGLVRQIVAGIGPGMVIAAMTGAKNRGNGDGSKTQQH